MENMESIKNIQNKMFCYQCEQTASTDKLILESLFTTVTNVNFNDDTVSELINKAENEK